MGDTYYLHEGRTKTGKPRYFVARSIREGALTAMPAGFAFTESINAVVSVARKTGPELSPLPATDLELVQVELSRHEHLWGHKAAPFKGDIVVYQPLGALAEAAFSGFARSVWLGLEETPAYKQRLAEARQHVLSKAQFDPVFKFSPATEPAGIYIAWRMCYRGRGGWLRLRSGRLTVLAQRYIRLLGTDELFEHF